MQEQIAVIELTEEQRQELSQPEPVAMDPYTHVRNQTTFCGYGRLPVNSVASSTKLIGLPNGSVAQNIRSPHGIR